MTAPVIRNVTSGSATTGSSIVVSMPTHQADDLILILLVHYRTFSSATGGFVRVDLAPASVDFDSDVSYIFKRASGSSEATTLTMSSSGQYAYAAYAISGIDWDSFPYGCADYDFQNKWFRSDYQQTNISTIYDNALLINFLASDNSAAFTTTPTLNSWTEDVDLSVSNTTLWAGRITRSAAGAVTGPSIAVNDSTFSAVLGTLHFVGVEDAPAIPKVQRFHGLEIAGTARGNEASPGQLLFRNVNYDWLLGGSVKGPMDTFSSNGFTAPAGLSFRYLLTLSGDAHLFYAKLDDTATSFTLTSGTTLDGAVTGFVIRGANENRPFVRIGWEDPDNASSIVAPALKTNADDQVHLAIFEGTSADKPTAAPSGYSAVVENVDTNIVSAFNAYTKTYSAAGSETSCTAAYGKSVEVYPASLLLSTHYTRLPAQVRAVGYFSATSAGAVDRYTMYADEGEILALLDAVTAATGESNWTITVPASLTHNLIASEVDAVNGWSLHAKACQLTSEITDGKVTASLAADVGGTHFLFVAIVSGSRPGLITGAETVNNTANAKTSISASVALGDGAVMALAQWGDTTTTLNPTATNAKRLLWDEVSQVGLFLDNSPDPSVGSVTETVSFASVTVKDYMMLVGFDTLGGGAGLFMGQDF